MHWHTVNVCLRKGIHIRIRNLVEFKAEEKEYVLYFEGNLGTTRTQICTVEAHHLGGSAQIAHGILM